MNRKKKEGIAVIEKKHSLAIRWCHWINFPVMAMMVWSGLLIFWANSDGRITLFGKPVFPDSFYHPKLPAWYPNFLPFSREDDGTRILYSLQFRLSEGMGWHFLFIWFFGINGLIYVLYLLFSGSWKQIVPLKNSFMESAKVVLFDLHLLKIEPPKTGIYNHAQRIAYTGVIFLGGMMLASGFAIYKPTQLWWLTALLGGYRMARWFHFWTTWLIVAFFAIHVGQVIKTGWNNFRSMVTGYAIEYVGTDSPNYPSQPEGPGVPKVPTGPNTILDSETLPGSEEVA